MNQCVNVWASDPVVDGDSLAGAGFVADSSGDGLARYHSGADAGEVSWWLSRAAAVIAAVAARERSQSGTLLAGGPIVARRQNPRRFAQDLPIVRRPVPLIAASGAGAARQKATVIGEIIEPVPYVLLQSLRERVKGRFGRDDTLLE
ncbi:MAG: hypothetical protein R8G34_09395 [Paracoccaceae bacterium]|nr:hypothetical protein [Paracoccaceae bacterium]